MADISRRLRSALACGGLVWGCSAPTITAPDDAGGGVRSTYEGGHPTGDLTSPAADAGAAPRPLTCPPAPTRYRAVRYVAATAHQGLCTATDISDFVSSCVDPGQSFAEWSSVNVAGFAPGGLGTPCGNCLFASRQQNNGAMWVDPVGLFGPNYAGCIQLLDPSYGPACAPALNDATACEADACEYCFGTNADYVACVDAADSNRCAPFAAEERSLCARDLTSGSLGAPCFSSNGGAADYAFIATLVCGAPSTDGGVDAHAGHD